MYTTTLDFRLAILSSLEDPTDKIFFGTTRQSDATDALDGEVRLLSGNVKKAVTYSSTQITIPVTMVALTPEQYQTFKDWRGTPLLLRLISGERLFCTYFAHTYKARYRSTLSDTGTAYNVSVTFQEITYDESAP